MPEIRLPDNSQHTLILGRTGSGKSFAAAWHLTKRDFDKMPWIIIDTKRDPFIQELSSLEGVKIIDIKSEPPTEPGLYIVRPLPHEEDEINDFLWKVWQHGNTGLWIDESYMVSGDAFNAILTQGRSKKIPVIMLAQRPTWLSPFAKSEPSFYQVFGLNDARDRKTVQGFVPYDLERPLDEYHSLWYDVGRNQVVVFEPVPPKDDLLETFRTRLKPPQEPLVPALSPKKIRKVFI